MSTKVRAQGGRHSGESRNPLAVREGQVAPYAAKNGRPRHSREGGNPASIEYLTLGDVLEVIRGVTYKKEDARPEPGAGLVPVLRATNIQDGVLNFHDLVYVPEENVSAQQLLQAGDIVIAASSGSRSVVGKAAPLSNDWHGSFGAFCFGLRPKVGTDPRFLAWFLQTTEYRNRVSELAAGVNINNLRAKHIEETAFRRPPLADQHRIVAELETQLTRLDASVTALKRAQANLKRYRASVLMAACEGRLVSTGTANWTDCSLGDVLTAIEAGRSYKCEERPPHDNEVGIVKVSAVTWGIFDERESKTPRGSARVEQRFAIEQGDFLFSRANTIELVGACVLVHSITKRLLLSDKILRFRFAANVLPAWALCWLKSDRGKKEIQRLATGNQESMRNIGQDRIKQIRFSVPPFEDQQRIVAEVERKLSVIDELEGAVAVNLKRAEGLRSAVLGKAFSS